jgi:hypothetical protein
VTAARITIDVENGYDLAAVLAPPRVAATAVLRLPGRGRARRGPVGKLGGGPVRAADRRGDRGSAGPDEEVALDLGLVREFGTDPVPLRSPAAAVLVAGALGQLVAGAV